ncbi:MAG: hypothetical protein Q4B69_00015 [Slackia sp.]|nr:hypothetical protein [Slackia sp.]
MHTSMTLKKVFGLVLGCLFVASLVPSVIAFANNHADTPYRFQLSYGACGDTENRAKYDDSSTYIKCTSNTGVAIVQSNGRQMGSVYTWGPKYPVGIGAQYIYNYVWEERPRTDVTAYCFLRFTNQDVQRTITTEGLWSPDSV